ncbi:MAG TPA: hypothetical protein VK438_02535 [Xanthobacteraceae bacterium]|nr:hypothetical protein [Xanthobacteraceae bacterium]
MPEVVQTTGASAAAFMLFVAGGCAYIVAAKLAGIGQLYVTFVPVGTMVAYALLIYFARGLRLRDDQSGDNLYYMGFLFTLTSLGVSLYQFSAARAAEEIVQNFGIAISTTIAGIGLRVLFNQMRRDPVEIERMMRLELAEAARRVRRELDSTVVEFGHHRRSAQQAAADSFKHAAEKFDEVVGRLFASLEQITARISGPLEEASRRSADTIAQAGESLSARAASIAAALDEVTAKLGAMQAPERVIEVRLEPAAQSLAQAADRLVTQSDGQAAAMKDALEMANAATLRSVELMTALRQELDAATSMNRASLDAATNMIKAMAEVLEEFKTSSRSYVEVLGFMLEKTDATMRTFTDVLVKSGVDATRQADGLRDMLPAIEASVQSLAAAGELISAAVEDLRPTRRAATRERID